MAVELIRWLTDKLETLPPNSPDRRFLEEIFERVQDYQAYVLSNQEISTPEGKFSPEQRRLLQKNGFVVYELSGKSIREYREKIKLDLDLISIDKHSFAALTTKATEVAFKPNKFLLGHGHDFSEQQSRCKYLSEEISQKVGGVKYIIGEANQYIELALLHFEKTGEGLFGSDGEQYEHQYTVRTATSIYPNSSDLLTAAFIWGEARLSSTSPSATYHSVAPLLVPSSY